MVKELLSRRLLTLVAPLIFLSAALPGGAVVVADQRALATSAVLAPAASTRIDSPSRQLAEDVTRRLRRMGINILKTRLDNPYDPDGELC